MLVQIMGFRHLRAFTMTAPTSEGDIQGIGRGLFVRRRQDIMLGMAVVTFGRHIVIVHKGGIPVGTFLVYCTNSIMTVSAVDRSEGEGMFVFRGGRIFMAGGAAIFGVDCFLKHSFIDKQTDGLTIFFGGQFLVTVALETLIVAESQDIAFAKQCSRQDDKQKKDGLWGRFHDVVHSSSTVLVNQDFCVKVKNS
jgi:hypothetical protein